jgi:iron complex transport system permease protein
VGGALALLLAALIAGPLVGSTSVDLARALADPLDWQHNVDAAVLFVARLPRVLLAAIVGGSLALAGATFQSLLRNPLATPYTLGVSAGATFAAALAMRFAGSAALGELTVPAAALLGALATAAVVLGLTARRGDLPTTVLLLAGVSLNYTIGAGVLLLQYFADYTETARMVRWMMGDLEAGSYRLLLLVAVGSLPAWVALARSGRVLNLMSLGPDEARAHGVDAPAEMRRGLLWASWVTGLAVAVAGPIGFVGIIVPHAVRLVAGADARIVLPTALLAGGAFLVACDALSRTLLAPIELPIGILTACLGGPFFLVLLLRRRAGI